MTQATPNPAPSQSELLQRQTELLEQISQQLKKQGRQTERQTEIAEDVSGWYSLAIAWVAYFVIIGIPVAQTGINATQDVWNNIADSRLGKMANLPLWEGGSAELGTVGAAGQVDVSQLDLRPIQMGDTANGFPVTSDFGPRRAPTAGASSNHDGVDIGAPVGTALHAPAAGKVNCYGDPSPKYSKTSNAAGYGDDALEFISSDPGVPDFFIGHNSACISGAVVPGQKMGEVGNEGVSTGPHPHITQYSAEGVPVDPQLGFIELIMGATVPIIKSSGGAFSVQSYKAAIAVQESGNDYSLVNPDSGAMGKYQFMPETMRSTASACPGVSGIPSTSQFLASPDLQEKIMDCYLANGLKTAQAKTNDPVIQCRMLASYHYSGSLDLWNNTAPQTYGGNSYPSIANYTKSVCKNVK